MRTLVIGLGNPILGDDAIGWQVIEALKETLDREVSKRVEFETFSLGGVALMERLVGYDRALIVDALAGRPETAGTLHRLTLDDLPTLYADSTHDVSLKTALEMGHRLSVHLPQEIVILAVEIDPRWEFSEQMSPAVERAILPAVLAAEEILSTWVFS
jgi:hydrogenase maturation protease